MQAAALGFSGHSCNAFHSRYMIGLTDLVLALVYNRHVDPTKGSFPAGIGSTVLEIADMHDDFAMGNDPINTRELFDA